MENQVGIHMNNTANDFTVMFCARSYFIKCIPYSYRIHLSNSFFKNHWQRFTSESVQSERVFGVEISTEWKNWHPITFSNHKPLETPTGNYYPWK